MQINTRAFSRFVLFLALALNVACVQNQEELNALRNQNQVLLVQNDSLRQLLEETDHVSAEIFGLTDAINLMQDSLISLEQTGTLPKAELLARLDAIKVYIAESNAKVDQYQTELESSGNKNQRLRRSIAQYRKQIERQENELAELRNQITQLETKNQTLTGRIERTEQRVTALSDTLSEQREALAEEREKLVSQDELLEKKAREASTAKAQLLLQEAQTHEAQGDKISTLGIFKKKKEEKRAHYQEAIKKYESLLSMGEYANIYNPKTHIFRLEDKIKKLGLK